MIDYRLPVKLRSAYLNMHRSTKAALADLGITADQYVCILILHEHGAIIQRELVEKADSDPNTIRAMLILLEKKKLVIRRKHATDNRAWEVQLTAEGEKIFGESEKRLIEINIRLYNQFNEEEALMLGNLLDRFAEIVNV